MCGISGTVSLNDAINPSDRVTRSVRELRHRGPNDVGIWGTDRSPYRIALGQTRLSIIDLSSGGHQPMISEDERYVITFNGEIYNYKELRNELSNLGCTFCTASDTEVLMQAWSVWGEQCLHRLKGMFAFVILDRHEHTLTCVRDAFGVKPLFYTCSPQGFSFASELPALRALIDEPHSMDESVMLDYLVSGRYDQGSSTFFEGFKRLEPGHIMRLNLSGTGLELENKRWWQPSIEEFSSMSFTTAVGEVRERFLENIRLHLRSDVPLGIALSGGVDSSAIASAVRYVDPDMDISTFSFIAPGTPVNEESWADVVNFHIGAKSHKVSVSAKELVEDLDDMIRAQGEPFGSTSIYAQYRVYKAAKSAGITVMLDGQGADELFAGYHGYPSARMQSLLRTGNLLGWAKLVNKWSAFPGRSLKIGLQHTATGIMPKPMLPLARRITGRDKTPNWVCAKNLNELKFGTETYSNPFEPDKGRHLSHRLREALTLGEMGVLLRHGDRNSMRWSMESRVPFLTTDFAEFALKLPESYLLSSQGETKHVLRAAMRGIVPEQVLARKDKVGFETPEHNWLLELRPNIEDWLSGLELIPFVDTSEAKSFVNRFLSGKEPFSWQVWRLINASRWVQLSFG